MDSVETWLGSSVELVWQWFRFGLLGQGRLRMNVFNSSQFSGRNTKKSWHQATNFMLKVANNSFTWQNFRYIFMPISIKIKLFYLFWKPLHGAGPIPKVTRDPPTQHSKLRTLLLPDSFLSHVSSLHHFFGMSENFPTPLLISLTQLLLSYVTIPSKLHPSSLSMFKQENLFLSQHYSKRHPIFLLITL